MLWRLQRRLWHLRCACCPDFVFALLIELSAIRYRLNDASKSFGHYLFRIALRDRTSFNQELAGRQLHKG